jgi:DNA-binding FadR family transcriptional regulator
METGGIELVQHLLPLAGNGRPELIRDMLEFRRIFGREVARYAAVRATSESLTRLDQLAEKAERTANMLDLFELDFEFYVALTQAAGNAVMGLLINTVRDGVRAYMPVLSNLAPSADLVRKHQRELIAALRARDHEKAMRIADDYLRTGAEMAARLGGRPELAPLPQPPL